MRNKNRNTLVGSAIKIGDNCVCILQLMGVIIYTYVFPQIIWQMVTTQDINILFTGILRALVFITVCIALVILLCSLIVIICGTIEKKG